MSQNPNSCCTAAKKEQTQEVEKRKNGNFSDADKKSYQELEGMEKRKTA